MTSQNTVLYTPFAGGRTVRDIVEHSPALVSEAWCRRILQHVLQSLEQQYASNAPHRIISPDRVVVLENGEALLLPAPDGLASAEADSAGDIHDLALVIHYAISAESPPEGPLGPRLYDHYSDQLTQTVDRCLGPNLRLRPKTIAELRALLGLDAGAVVQVLAVDEPPAPAVEPEEVPLAQAALPVASPEMPLQMPLEAPLEAPLELSKAEAHDADPAAPAAAPLAPAPAPAPRPAQPSAATPLKPSAHSASAPAAPRPAAPAAAARAKARTGAPAARHKGGVERWAMAAGAVIVLLAAGSALYVHLNQDNSADVLAASLPQETAPQGLDAGETMLPTIEGGETAAPAQENGAPIDGPQAGAMPDAIAAAPATPGAVRPAAAPAAPQAEAVVNGTTYKLLIKPWGTVYVNGVDRGVSPPVKRLTLGQGEHTIRIVNPNFAEHMMTVNAGATESATIEHDFTAPAEGGR